MRFGERCALFDPPGCHDCPKKIPYEESGQGSSEPHYVIGKGSERGCANKDECDRSRGAAEASLTDDGEFHSRIIGPACQNIERIAGVAAEWVKLSVEQRENQKQRQRLCMQLGGFDLVSSDGGNLLFELGMVDERVKEIPGVRIAAFNGLVEVRLVDLQQAIQNFCLAVVVTVAARQMVCIVPLWTSRKHSADKSLSSGLEIVLRRHTHLIPASAYPRTEN